MQTLLSSIILACISGLAFGVERCDDPRKAFPGPTDYLCVNVPGGVVRHTTSSKCYRSPTDTRYNENGFKLARLALGVAAVVDLDERGCITYPWAGDKYDIVCGSPCGNDSHAGIDLRGNGNTVFAIESGRVLNDIYDKDNRHSTLIIENESKTHAVAYLHMLRDAPFKKGEPVAKSQTLGKVGAVGAPAPHLHIEVWSRSSTPQYTSRTSGISKTLCQSERMPKTSTGNCTASEIEKYSVDPLQYVSAMTPCNPMPPAPGLSGQDAALALGATKQQDRLSAVASLARNGKIKKPLGADEIALILRGTTSGYRAMAIAEVSAFAKGCLSGADFGMILGDPVTELAEQDRLAAIAAIARASKIDRSMRNDAAIALKGVTGDKRANAIGEIARYLGGDLTGSEIAEVLGSASLLNGQARLGAIAAIARADRTSHTLGAEMVPVLAGTTGQTRATAISELSKAVKPDITGKEVAAFFGSAEEINEQPRAAAIAAIARSGRLTKSLDPADAELLLKGITGQNRAMAIGEISNSLRSGLSGHDIARILGGQNDLAEQARLSAIASIARARKNHPNMSGQELDTVVEFMSGSNRAMALGELSWKP